MSYHINEFSAEVDEGFPADIPPQLDESLDAMGDKDREVLTLHYLEGLPFKTISERLGGSAEAWQKRSVRALQKLADKLRSRGVTVSAVALGAFFASARAEAGVATAALDAMTRCALEQGAKGAAILGKTAILLTMKTGIAISLTSGVLLAYGWGTVSPHKSSKPPAAELANGTEITGSDEDRRAKRDRGFTVEMVRQVVSEYDSAKETDPLTESRLRSLMFLVPENISRRSS